MNGAERFEQEEPDDETPVAPPEDVSPRCGLADLLCHAPRVCEPAPGAVVDSWPMEYTHVGHLGLQVSRLCLGTMNFGPHASEEDSHTIMDTAVAYGINFFDTANVYGRHLGVGATEEIIGRWFDKGEGRRDAVVLATKV